MNEFRFICARLILDERVLKILSVTERHTHPDDHTIRTVIYVILSFMLNFISRSMCVFFDLLISSLLQLTSSIRETSQRCAIFQSMVCTHFVSPHPCALSSNPNLYIFYHSPTLKYSVGILRLLFHVCVHYSNTIWLSNILHHEQNLKTTD